MTLQTKREYIEATQITNEMILGFTPLPENVILTRGSYHCGRQQVYSADLELRHRGESTQLSVGDWVATYPDGHKVGFTGTDLFNLFELADGPNIQTVNAAKATKLDQIVACLGNPAYRVITIHLDEPLGSVVDIGGVFDSTKPLA